MFDWIRKTFSLVSSTLGDAAFRLGRLDRATRDYQPPATSGDLAAIGSSDLMHRRARDQIRNNAHCRKGCDAWQDLLVGTGLQTLADPFEPWLDLSTLTPQDLDERLAWALESDELYAEWFNDPKQFSADGRFAGPDLQRLIVSELVAAGGVFLVESFKKRTGSLVPLCYQLVEVEHLDRSINRNASATDNRVVEGIELNADGEEVAYYLFVEHPFGVQGAVSSSRRVPATRCQYISLVLRPSQHHGVTWLHASGQPEIDRDKFLSSELQTAAKAAAICLKYKKRNPYAASLGLLDGNDVSDATGNQQVKLSGSPMAVVIGLDEDVEVVESSRPSATAEPFLRVLDRYSAGGMGLSYYTLSGDYASTSFSSLRGAKLDEDGHVRPLQQWFGFRVAIPMRKRFNSLAAAMGLFSTVEFAEFAANPRRYQRFEAMGPGRELLDPEAETNAAIARLRSGLSTLKLECGKRGLHWVRVLRQSKLENQLTSVLGIVLDFSKGQGGQVTQTTRDGTAGSAASGTEAAA